MANAVDLLVISEHIGHDVHTFLKIRSFLEDTKNSKDERAVKVHDAISLISQFCLVVSKNDSN